MDGEGSKSRDEIWIAKWVVGGCDSIYAYFMVSILLDFAPPQLDFAAGSYAMEGADRAGVAPWRRADGAGVVRRGGEAGCCAHHRCGCGQPEEIQPAEVRGRRCDWGRCDWWWRLSVSCARFCSSFARFGASGAER